MSDTVIRVHDLSKQYRLGKVGTGTLKHDINRLWHSIRGKDDPYLKIGESNDRTVKGSTDYVWALKDIDFEVKQGEVLGIIGRNGAGKSTLLKILSRTTTPTTGYVKMKGKVASLLEVGTGFHPELSGRENIFLNGAILGMARKEIQRKFDEIVDFAGIERYIDTPVKRYSSGMYVRLAFAVAAYLEPEILIVDEVLAVGDAEFQKKCLGKMSNISKEEGRTILFVSHNMAAIESLCSKCLLLQKGTMTAIGGTQEIITAYTEPAKKMANFDLEQRTDRIGSGKLKVTRVAVKRPDGTETESVPMGTPFSVEIDYKGSLKKAYVAVMINGAVIESIIQANSFYSYDGMADLSSGKLECLFNENILLAGEYNISVHIGEVAELADEIHNCQTFYVETRDIYNTGRAPVSSGLVYARHSWKFD
jgi:lipopolysaccharide transport system ATP-binding protein